MLRITFSIKNALSAYAVLELAMFGIMVLFLSFCGFFTFKHCFYNWRKKKRRRRSDSLESILDLLYNEDYYYLESTTPYLPEDDESSNDCSVSKVSEDDEDLKNDEACLDSVVSQGRSVKWSGPEKISIDKFKVCPQTVKMQDRRVKAREESKRELKRQITVYGSSENILQYPPTDDTSLQGTSQTREYPQMSNTWYQDLGIGDQVSSSEYDKPKQSYGDHKHSSFGSGKLPTKKTSISFSKIIVASKLLGERRHANEKRRVLTGSSEETPPYDSETHDAGSESPRGSLEKKPLLKRESLDIQPKVKRQVNFSDSGARSHGHEHRHKHKHLRGSSAGIKRSGILTKPNSAFWLPRPRIVEDKPAVNPYEERSPAGDVEELCQEYERLEKKRYAQMLKKAKAFGRESLPFFHRKH